MRSVPNYPRTRWHYKNQPTVRDRSEYHGNAWRAVKRKSVCPDCGQGDLAWLRTGLGRRYLTDTRRLPGGGLQAAAGREHRCRPTSRPTNGARLAMDGAREKMALSVAGTERRVACTNA
jgi:hypothetical protein